MNRDERRHPGKHTDLPKPPREDARQPDRSQDALDPRTKNSGHGKKTADKWNQ
jgi:hypothetical protein